MVEFASTPYRVRAPLRVVDGFGRSTLAACRFLEPRSVEELAGIMGQAQSEGISVAFRGAGRSYGDASINSRGLVIDATGLNRLLDWNPTTGVLEAEAGLTIEGLWRRTIEDGYWPTVVPGTMRPTLGGCVSMNIHGKNNFRVGPFGDHVLELDLITPGGDRLTLSRSQNSELFHAVIGGLGMLGAVTRVKLKLKKVESGNLRVESISARNLDEMFDVFEQRLPDRADYLVGWVDCFAKGKGLGRGQVHAAHYLHAGEDPMGAEGFHVERQGLPGTILGIPKSELWRIMRLFSNKPLWGLINKAKYHSSWREHGKSYLQSHVAFAFLLDYVPNWRLAYGPGGFIQYQVFVPKETARETMKDVLNLCHQAKMPSFLGVFKRHRPDPFLLTHALDGWSMAMDFPVTPKTRNALWALTERLSERVIAGGGKFYFAKDSVLRAGDVEQSYGRDKVERFLAIKQQLDPTNMLSSDLWQRALAPLAKPQPPSQLFGRAAE
ncbi:MAG TPA: FAD-binding oxidoreductase [Polyangiaceae bacterium]|nr:FAD-binding oxidoreductase [Polyangiaceae bacterium]